MWNIEHKYMTDGSDDWRVVYTDADQPSVTIACINHGQADKVLALLRLTAWVEVGPESL